MVNSTSTPSRSNFCGGATFSWAKTGTAISSRTWSKQVFIDFIIVPPLTSNRLQVSHRATERSDRDDRVVGVIENRCAQFRRLLKKEQRAPVVLLNAFNLKTAAAQKAGQRQIGGLICGIHLYLCS